MAATVVADDLLLLGPSDVDTGATVASNDAKLPATVSKTVIPSGVTSGSLDLIVK